jgi:hypothetical protein
MQIQTLTIQPIAPTGAAIGAMPEYALVARAVRWLSIAAAVFATITVVLLASALAVMMNLS